jgi:hypothetical protein
MFKGEANMSEKPHEMTFKYLFSDDYSPAYINGAHGGLSPRGELVVNFYLERPPLPDSVTHEITPAGGIGTETAVEPAGHARTLVRQVTGGVVLNYETAAELHHWIGEKLKEMQAVEQAKNAMNTGISAKTQATH